MQMTYDAHFGITVYTISAILKSCIDFLWSIILFKKISRNYNCK